MRWLAPVLAHPCSPSLASCLSRPDTPSPASTTQKSIWDLGSPSSFAFCNPSGIFFSISRGEREEKSKERASFSFLVERVAYLRPFFCTATFSTSSFPGGFSKASRFKEAFLTIPILHLRSVRYGGKHQSRTLHTTSDPYANSLVLGPNIIFFPRPPLLAIPPGIFSPPGLPSLCLLHGRPDGARNRPARFPVSRCSQAIPPVSRSSLALPIHNLELGGTTSPRCAHCASTPKPSLPPHQAHHQQQGHPPSQQLQHSRPPSIVHQQHHPHSQHQPPQHHQGAYSSQHTLPQAYQAGNQATSTPETLNYYNHPSPYSTPGATSGYTSADTSDMMAAAQMPRPPYPPMSYHTPQSNSPASVASPSQHDQHRNLYGQPQSQHLQQSMYYQPPPQYQSMPHQAAPSPYAQHAHHHQQSMASQPNMMMSHAAQQNQMPPHAAQHAQHAQAGMTGSPRPKIEPQVPLQLQKQQPSPMSQPHHQQGPPQLQSPANPTPAVNPNAAPGPIPATTPLVVRQDGNGVQWIAFEYSRDRVKMEYTIRCDVESVNIEELSPEFKQENCVYPRACCPKDQYRGNRLIYETECNRVGWALAQLNVPLRGKRGLIQRAVDSWRNSNQDPRLRSRRVRRMAKMNSRKQQQQVQGAPHPGAHMSGPGGPGGHPGAPAPMPTAHAPNMGKPTIGGMGQPMHHHHAGGHPDGGAPGGEEVGEGNNPYEDNHHHHQAPTAQMPPAGNDDVRQAHVFAGYAGPGSYPVGPQGGSMSHMAPRTNGAIPARSHSRADDANDDLFPDIPEAKRRKFILVEDNVRASRLRVRVTLDGVDTNEIPDSFRKGASVFPRSFFPREMQSPPPSATGSQFFVDDVSDDGTQETEGREASRRGAEKSRGEVVKITMAEGQEREATIPRMRKSGRVNEVRLNDLGYRMAWLQSRVFSGRTVFLQRALDCYRNKTRAAIEGAMVDVQSVAPHFETRPGKRRWANRMKRGAKNSDD